ncbi:MAG: 50S ribosomal protein L5 [Vampirovibrionales bacterium]|nr:50S ribosomal protein L5 [Vampirovibrionales bacterium]
MSPSKKSANAADSNESLKAKFQAMVHDKLMAQFGFKNTLEVPRLMKIVINIGAGDAGGNAKILDTVLTELTTIAGQKAVVTRAKKSIAGFKVREGMPIGVMVTLRGERMYDFLSKYISIVMPRIRDFRGMSVKGFDGSGNYNVGMKDQIVFPEIKYDKVDKLRGMNITFVTTAKNNAEALAYFEAIGFPFRDKKADKADKQDKAAA